MDDGLRDAFADAEVSPWAAIQQLPVPISIVSPGGDQLAGNQAYWEMLACPPGSSIDVLAITHPDDREATEAYLAELREGRVPDIDIEKRYVRADGTTFWGELRSRPLLDDHGGVVGLIGAITDVTARRDVEAELERQLRRRRKLLDGLRDVVLECDVDGLVLERYGATWWSDDPVGSRLVDLVEPASAHDVAALMADAVADGDARGDLAMLGGIRALVTMVDQRSDGDVGTVVVTLRDVTAERDAWAELVSERDRAADESRRSASFIAEAAHDIRSPLQGVVGLTELLAGHVPAAHGWWSEELIRAATGLTELVGEVLDVSRFQQRVESAERVDVDVRALLSQVELASQLQARAGVQVVVDVAADVPARVTTSPDVLRRAVQNLVANSVRHTRVGRVTVGVHLGASDALVVEVADTGPGIPPEVLPRIFEPGVSAGPERGAAGLGLTIVRTLVARLGGEVSVESALGAGATFRIELPGAAGAAPQPAAPPTSPRSRRDLDGLRLLLVEDDELNRRSLSAQLEVVGIEVHQVGDGESAISTLADAVPDVVILDGRLPGVHGDEVARWIRANDLRTSTGRPLPVIGLSASLLPDDAHGEHYDARLAKPVTQAQLLAAIDGLGGGEGEAAATSAPPVVDLEHLARLADEVGDGAIVESVVSTFLAELPGRLEAIELALGAGNADGVATSAHQLASAALSVGARALGERCRRVEREVLDGGALPSGAELVLLAGRTSSELDRWRQAPPGSSSR